MTDGPIGEVKDAAEAVHDLQALLIARATGETSEPDDYRRLRRAVLARADVRGLVPPLVRLHRDLDSFWEWIKAERDSYASRRSLLREAFRPLLDHLESERFAPSDEGVADALAKFDSDAVHRAWARALDRRERDPEGAITAARTLLEAVIKHVLDATEGTYNEADDLPKLYYKASLNLALAPDQHAEVVFRAILGNCAAVVNGLGTLRTKVGDAHAQGDAANPRRVRPSPRHAALAVNLAGAVATFLIATLEDRAARETATRLPTGTATQAQDDERPPNGMSGSARPT